MQRLAEQDLDDEIFPGLGSFPLPVAWLLAWLPGVCSAGPAAILEDRSRRKVVALDRGSRRRSPPRGVGLFSRLPNRNAWLSTKHSSAIAPLNRPLMRAISFARSSGGCCFDSGSRMRHFSLVPSTHDGEV